MTVYGGLCYLSSSCSSACDLMDESQVNAEALHTRLFTTPALYNCENRRNEAETP
jgi:hypothetical protein